MPAQIASESGGSYRETVKNPAQRPAARLTRPRRAARGTDRRCRAFVGQDAGVIAELEVRKLRHDPTELITRAMQPALWLLVFGQVFTRVRAIPTGDLRYLDFMAPGILAQSVLFIAIFYGIAIIWERDLGIIQKFLVSPTPRAALVLGKALSAGVRAPVAGGHRLRAGAAARRQAALEPAGTCSASSAPSCWARRSSPRSR